MGAPEGAKPRVQGKPRELRPQNGPERLPRPPKHPRCTTRPLVRTLATQVFIPVGCVIVTALTSSSQSALSERPGRWNGRVERGAESARKRDCSHGDCPPTLVGLRGGRLSLTADLSYEPPSPRDARPAHLGPSPSVHRPTRLTRPLAGAGSQASPPGRRASSERGAGARDILSKPACRCMHGRSETLQPLEWLRSRPSRQVDKRGGGQ